MSWRNHSLEKSSGKYINVIENVNFWKVFAPGYPI